jgi:hypothetical protein
MADPPPGLEIVKATYGAEQYSEDVTKAVKDLIRDGSLSLTVSPQAFGIIDPAPGITKILQVNASLNGAAPTLFSAEDSKQLVINAPTITKDEGPKSVGSQFTAVVWYILVAFIGTFFVVCSYSFGAYGLGSSFLGMLFALVVAIISITLGITQSHSGIAGLIVLVLAAGGLPLSIAFMICLVDPDYINFDWAKKAVVQAVTDTPPIE